MPYSPSAEHPVSQFVAYCLETCERGFRNEHHWRAWLGKWQVQINFLHEKIRERILAAHENATWIGFREQREPHPKDAP